MASPQKENGYTAIANEIMDYLCKYSIPASQRQCLDFILRKTYGYGKKEDAISFSQFEAGTNMDRRHINRALNDLSIKNIIKVSKGIARNGNRDTSKYCINKDYASWVVLPKKARGIAKKCKRVLPDLERTIVNKQKKEKNIPDSIESVSFYLTKKKRKLSNKRLETFEIFWEKFNYKKGKADAADSWYDIPTLTDTLVNQIYISAENEATEREEKISNGQTPKWAQGWLTSRRWEDETNETLPDNTNHHQPTALELINA